MSRTSPIKVDVFAVQSIRSFDLSLYSRHLKVQLAEAQVCLAEREVSGKFRGDVGDAGIVGLPLSSAADFRDRVLHLVIGKARVGDIEAPVESHLLQDRLLARRQNELRFQLQSPGQQSRVGLGGERQHILHSRPIEIDIQRDRLPMLTRLAGDFAAGGHVGIKEVCFDRLQIGVAVGAVDDGMKLCGQMNGLTTVVKLEVGNISGSIDDDVVQNAAILAN